MVYNVKNHRIQQHSLADIEKSIKQVLEVREWRLVEKKDNQIIAEIYVRSHYAKIQIDYSTNDFSITYLSSNNLRYSPKIAKIHRNYNHWVRNLEKDITLYLNNY